MSAADLLAAGGPLAAAIPGFTPRAEQQQMAEAVASALADGKPLIVEAGTGTGKTFAYLAPVLRSGQRVAISTGTKNLQDQLFHRDLPVVRAALHAGARVALLKGRGNYLCLYRMKRARGQPGLRFMDDRLSAIEAWARGTENGELSELGHFTEGDAVTRQVTSTADNCLGAKCPDFGPCFVAKARRNAQAAEVVVINHSLLLSDYVLRNQSDFGSLLSSLDAVIVDEAHQLPELAANFFGEGFGMRPLQELARDCLAE